MKGPERLYTLQFLQVLIGTSLTMVGLSMQYHFGEFVAHLGYREDVLGWITGIGACGSIVLRPQAGAWIDRVGCRRAFLASAVCGAAANFSFQFAESLPLVCVLRVVMVASNATFLATTAVFAAQVAPPPRRAESLGIAGIGGFLGMMIGPAIGDAIFAHAATPAEAFPIFFSIVSGASLLAGLMVINLRPPPHAVHYESVPFLVLLRRYWPGTILLVPVVFMAALTIHISFLERYAHHRGFEDIRWFFFVYSPTAITLRLFFRRVPERVGRARLCVAGLTTMAAGVLLFIPACEEWHLVFPALLMGCGHAFVFPSMVDLAAEAMPPQHRGVGTSIALGAGDAGMLAGGIAWGELIEWRGWTPTFIAVAAAMWLVAALYAWVKRGVVFGRMRDSAPSPSR